MSARPMLLLVGLAVGVPAQAAGPPKTDDRPTPELADPPDVRLRPRPPLTIAKAVRIKALIARLATVDRPDIGYSPTFGGFAFLPVPGHIREHSLTWTNHRLKSSQPLRDLVAIGPDALPFLLDALGDKTPTKLVLKHGGAGGTSEVIREGSTRFSNELPGNELNPRESRLIDQPGRRSKESKHVPEYTVRVGDLCFVAIGQITGRGYMAARYQMTACTVINSPVEDAAFRERIRKIWSSNDPARTLFESLWFDYRSTHASHFQTGAVLRLLYYFPEESAPVIAARLNKLDVSKAVEGTDTFTRQRVANGGVYADEFVHAAAWCKVPAVRAAVRDVSRRTGNVDVFAFATEAFGPDESALLLKKADELLAGLTPEELKLGARKYLLGVTAARAGAAAVATFRRLMEKATPAELGEAAGALEDAEGDWPVALLKPLLDDRRDTARVYYVRDGQVKGPVPAPPVPPVPPPGGSKDDGLKEVPVRVCDAAAEALAVLLPGERGKFPKEHDRATLDRYITSLKEKLHAK